MYKEVVWVTGASSGIGREMVVQLNRMGYRIIASGRNRQALELLASQFSGVDILDFDVADDASVPAVQRELLKFTDHIDKVILNAGNCEYLDFQEPRWEMIKEITAVNFYGMVNCVEAALPLLKKAQSPQIVGICSQATQAPFPRAEAYGASKAAARYFLESLRMDLKPFNIDVTVILPGFVDTPLTQKNDFQMPFLMPADQAVKRILTAVFKRKLFYAFPRRLSFLLWLARHIPKLWLKINTGKVTLDEEIVEKPIADGTEETQK